LRGSRSTISPSRSVGIARTRAPAAALLVSQTFTPTPEGDALFGKQDWAGAAREFKTATERSPEDGRAWFRLGASFHRMGQYHDAAFERAVQYQFQTPMAMAGVARAYAALNDPAKAIEWLNKAGAAGFAQMTFVDSDPHLSALKACPEFAAIHERIRLNGKPCVTGAEYRQFDFWVGEWDVEVSGRKIAHSRIEKIADGCIIQENWMPLNGVEGKSWNFYNSATGKWEQLWMSAGSVLKLEGQIKSGALVYTGVTPQPSGPSVQERLTFTPLENGKVHQFWEQSRDAGKTWTVAFDGIYLPRELKETAMSDVDRGEVSHQLLKIRSYRRGAPVPKKSRAPAIMILPAAGLT
jgi:hypothetical protein